MAIVVSDTSPLRALKFLDLMDLLESLFPEVLVPPAVAAELMEPLGRLPPLDLRSYPFLRIQRPRDEGQMAILRARLDPGEAEAIALAIEVRAEAILIDEAEGRSVAAEFGLTPIGALGILLEGKALGRLQSVKPLMVRLESDLRFFMSAKLKTEVLRRAGEL